MADASPTWDPAQYNRFEAERDRPARDLLARLPSDLAPREIWDLGCGTGHHAAVLGRRYPDAAVHGLDSSAEMLATARTSDPEVDWRQGDIATWSPERPTDLILANASLQWLPDHASLIPELARSLAPGGVIAIQMPMAWETLHLRTMRAVAVDGPWASSLVARDTIRALLTPEDYYDLLSRSCTEIDIWSTTYLHALGGADPVLEWMKGTALRPYVTALTDEPLRTAFLDVLAARLRDAFPVRADGVTLLPFPRLFLVARRR